MLLDFLGFLHLRFIDIIDIAVVGTVLFFLFKWMRNSSAMNIFVAILILIAIRIAAVVLDMQMISGLLGTVIDVGAIALVVIFQPEIRQFLGRLGRRAGNGNGFLNKILKRQDETLEDQHIQELADACKDMSSQMTGALIVLLHKDALQDVIDTGDTIDAEIRSRLIQNIFFKNSPLHDGAMVIGGGRIIAARCTLPITDRMDIPAHYGMRHKAAIGISEVSDADVIVVSEQTGTISFVKEGIITPVTGKNNLKLLLGNKLNGNEGREA